MDQRNSQESRAFMGRWLWILFWMIIPSSIASVISDESVVGNLPFLDLPGRVFSILCVLAYGLILLKLSQGEARENHYRLSGVLRLVCAAEQAVLLAVPGADGLAVLSAVTAAVSLVGEYQEYRGHADVAWDVDRGMSGKWRRLWFWYVTVFVAAAVSVLLMITVPLAGLVLLLAGSVGMVVVSVLKLVYLYRMARMFRRR